MKTYTTLDDLIAEEILPALGEYVEEYDVRAIAHEISDCYQGRWDEQKQAWWVTDAGFYVREDIDTDDFWEIVERNMIDSE